VEAERKTGKFEIKPGIQTTNERKLDKIISTGIAGKLYTGRSRNGQVGT
jgi:argininosuccinate lyase